MIQKSRKFLSYCFSPFPSSFQFNFAQGNQSDDYMNVLKGKAYLSDKLIK